MIAFFTPVKQLIFEVCVKGRAGRNTNHSEFPAKIVRHKAHTDIPYRTGYWRIERMRVEIRVAKGALWYMSGWLLGGSWV